MHNPHERVHTPHTHAHTFHSPSLLHIFVNILKHFKSYIHFVYTHMGGGHRLWYSPEGQNTTCEMGAGPLSPSVQSRS